MADLPNAFWGGWVIVIVSTSALGLAWLLFSIYFGGKGEEADSQVWDENLTKGAKPAPLWWFWLTLGLLVFSVIYLMLYPGLGTYSGFLKWSQGGRLDASYVSFAEDFDGMRTEIANSSMTELRNDPGVMNSAARVYKAHCAACHGPRAEGQAAMFPDLTDRVWQWGGSEAQLEQTIRGGRQAVMPGWEAALGETGVRDVTRYVATIARGGTVAADDPGQKLYATYCVACHGATGAGNVAIGAPSLTAGTWTYGMDDAALEYTIAKGRAGRMPAFGDRLDDAQIRMLIAWLSR